MPQPTGRYPIATQPRLAEGWRLDRLTPISHLFGANGMRVGPDGRIHIAQVSGSQISALDIDTGIVEAISPLGGDIVAPDDLAFDAEGNLYATEVMDARVSVRRPDGSTRVLRDDLPSANGITIHQGRLFVDECRIGGRLMELSLDGGAPRVLLEDIPMPNALEMGPDGMLYFPVMGANEIWRIKPEGGAAERVVGDLGLPDAVKFDAKGFIVSTQAASGEVFAHRSAHRRPRAAGGARSGARQSGVRRRAPVRLRFQRAGDRIARRGQEPIGAARRLQRTVRRDRGA